MDFSIVTAEWLQAKMKEHKVSGVELARAMNTTKTSVSRWVNDLQFGEIAKAGVYHYFKTLDQTSAKVNTNSSSLGSGSGAGGAGNTSGRGSV